MVSGVIPGKVDEELGVWEPPDEGLPVQAAAGTLHLCKEGQVRAPRQGTQVQDACDPLTHSPTLSAYLPACLPHCLTGPNIY